MNSSDEILDEEMATIMRNARAAMSDREWRRQYNKIDFALDSLSEQQKAALNSPFRYTYIKAGNQSGKTHVGAVKTACIALGREPVGYTGYCQPALNLARDHRKIWCISATNLMTRDGAQTRLFGDVMGKRVGTEMVPADRIVSLQAARGVAGLLDTGVVRGDDGVLTNIRFKSADQAMDALQSEAVDFIWVDEMLSSLPMWNELLARLTATSGSLWLTATPRKQQSPIARWFKEGGRPDRGTIRMSVYHTTHLTPEQVAGMEASYSPLEKRTRLEGEDYAGGGLVLYAPKELCGMDRPAAAFHEHMPRIVGFDPHHGGLSETAHPSGVLYGVYLPDTDALYVVDGWKQRHITPEQTVARIKASAWGNAPVAWGRAENQGAGGQTAESYMQMYKRLGLRMLPQYATLPGGSVSLDLTFEVIQSMILNGTLKINNHIFDLWDEIAGLERDDAGKILYGNDDLLAALRYMVLSRKSARVSLPDEGGVFDDMYRRMYDKPKNSGDFNLFATGYDYSND